MGSRVEPAGVSLSPRPRRQGRPGPASRRSRQGRPGPASRRRLPPRQTPRRARRTRAAVPLATLVIAPPLVYLTVVAVLKYVHRGPDAGPRKVLAEVAAELALGQGFTVMAAATGTALVLALVRWAARR